MLAGLLFDRIEKTTEAEVSFSCIRCLRSRLNTNTCERCVSHCHSKALTIVNRTVSFSEEKCTGCMVCVSACPNEAFSYDSDLATLLSAVTNAQEGQPARISCKRSRSPAPAAVIPCLGLLSEPILAAMHSIAAQDFFLDVRHCSDCENTPILNLLQNRIQSIINKIGESSHLKIRYFLGDSGGKTDVGQQRRFFLHAVKKSMVGLGRDAVGDACGSGFMTAELQENQKQKDATSISLLLRKALSMLGVETATERKLLLTYLYSLSCSDACDLCPSCSGMCPTGAMKRRTENETKHLYFTSAKCSGCGLCVEFCRKKALTLRPGISEAPDAAVKLA